MACLLKRHAHRYTVLLAIGISLSAPSNFAASHSDTHRIKASSLAKALVQFVAETGVGVIVDPNVDTSIVISATSIQPDHSKTLLQMLSGLPLIVEKNTAGYYVIRPAPAIKHATIFRPRIEEQIITGSSIKGGLGRSMYPLTILDRSELEASGSPSLVDLVANIPSISGSFNQSNQFQNLNAAGTANINLRGLGVSRTLVLLNGKRMATSALPHNDGQAFTDINTIPTIALQQIDILKDGASATYGSDAVAGVVNFITRRDFEGFEWQASKKYIDGSDGDWDIGFLSGGSTETSHWLASLSYTKRNELKNSSRDNIIYPRIDIAPLQRIVYSVSSQGNPGSFIPIDAATAVGGVSDAEVATAAMGRNNYVRDPQCASVGGYPMDNARCGFNYVTFDNIVEEEEHWQAFGSWQAELPRTHFGRDALFYSELNASFTEIDHWNTTPSYAPVKEADAARYLPSDHPALLNFLNENPAILENDGDIADFSGGAVFIGRPIGVSGEPASGYRSHETIRLLTGMSGSAWLDYDLSFTYARNQAESRTKDTIIDRWQSALEGFGGPNCSGNIAGQNGCEYFNPFASSISFSPNYDANLANSASLLSWMKDELIQNNTSQLMVADALFSGSYLYNDEQSVDYSLGLQYRQERLKIRFNDISDVTKNPGNITAANELPGAFVFFRGGYEDDVKQNIAAAFAEMAVPVQEDLLLHLALRYENYEGSIGQSLDPKIALRWQATPELTFRASAGTSFRAPSLNQTSLDTTSLELIGSAFAFKAVDRIGNPDLEPEQAINSNLGISWWPNQHWQLTLDYWRFDLSDAIVQESANAIVNSVIADPNSPLASQVVLDGSGNLSRVISNYVNGPDILVDGFDLTGEYRNWLLDGTLSVGWELAYLNRYDVGKSDLLPAFSADGQMNTGTFLRSLPKLRSNMYVNFNRGMTNTRLVANTVSSYTDDGLDVLKQTSFDPYVTETTVDAFYTLDSHFSLTTPSEDSSITFSILNIADKKPPHTRQDMRFDTTQHNAFGRMFKINLRHKI